MIILYKFGQTIWLFAPEEISSYGSFEIAEVITPVTLAEEKNTAEVTANRVWQRYAAMSSVDRAIDSTSRRPVIDLLVNSLWSAFSTISHEHPVMAMWSVDGVTTEKRLLHAIPDSNDAFFIYSSRPLEEEWLWYGYQKYMEEVYIPGYVQPAATIQMIANHDNCPEELLIKILLDFFDHPGVKEKILHSDNATDNLYSVAIEIAKDLDPARQTAFLADIAALPITTDQWIQVREMTDSPLSRGSSVLYSNPAIPQYEIDALLQTTRFDRQIAWNGFYRNPKFPHYLAREIVSDMDDFGSKYGHYPLLLIAQNIHIPKDVLNALAESDIKEISKAAKISLAAK